MHVTLMHHTTEPLREMYARTRGTTTSQGFQAVYDQPERFFPKAVREQLGAVTGFDEQNVTVQRLEIIQGEMIRLVRDALDSGHMSVSRGVHFHFAFEVSRSASLQMVRHKIAVEWEQSSQRYVKLFNRAYVSRLQAHADGLEYRSSGGDDLMDEALRARDTLEEGFIIPPQYQGEIINPTLLWGWLEARKAELTQYLDEMDAGIPAEDARENLPNATRTQLTADYSFESLQTFLAKRLCDRAQLPIRSLAIQMRKLALSVLPWAGSYLAVQCVLKGHCPEKHPGGCPLHANNGGAFLSREQLDAAAKAYRAQLRAEAP